MLRRELHYIPSRLHSVEAFRALAAMRCIHGIVFWAALLAFAQSAIANVLDLKDYESIYELNSRLRIVSIDVSKDVEAATKTQECMIRLGGSLDVIIANVSQVATLVALAARMVHKEDESSVLERLELQTQVFQGIEKDHRRIIELTSERCSGDSATGAKSSEILRLYSEATMLVQSIGTKIGAITPK